MGSKTGRNRILEEFKKRIRKFEDRALVDLILKSGATHINSITKVLYRKGLNGFVEYLDPKHNWVQDYSKNYILEQPPMELT